MRQRLISVLLVALACGCAHRAGFSQTDPESDGFGGAIADWAAEGLFGLAQEGIQEAAGDDAGPVFTGESRGEHRDRKEVERLGMSGFERKHGRAPDLYLAPGSSDW